MKEMMTQRGQGGLKKERRGEIKHEVKVMCAPKGGVEGGGRGRRLTDGHRQTFCLQNYSTVKTLRAFRQQTLLTTVFGPSV